MPATRKVCGLQILGDVKPVSSGVWDGGWIIDPEKDLKTKYSVELTLMDPKSLKVVGYLGTKFFSETMTWKRAPQRPEALRRLSGRRLRPCARVRGPWASGHRAGSRAIRGGQNAFSTLRWRRMAFA